MSTSVLPTIPGLTYPLPRTTILSTRKPASISGKETRISEWSVPRYKWELTYSVLRQGTFTLSTLVEYATLEGFFEQMNAGGDSFLYTDAIDNTVTTQGIATGDGATKNFALVRAFGGYVIPVLAPNLSATVHVYLNAVLQSGANYTITPWGTADAVGPGVIKFVSAPGNGVAITADFQFYFPVRFDDDQLTFEQFMVNLYELKKVTFTSIK